MTKQLIKWTTLISIFFVNDPTSAGPISSFLYPWNLTVGGYYTHGEYSSGAQYQSKMGYLSMDKRWKDRFTLSIESVEITSDSSSYSQTNIFAKDHFWINSKINIGGIVGIVFTPTNEKSYESYESPNPTWHITTSTDEQNYQQGFITGMMISGDLSWVGYSTSILRFQFNDYYDWTKTTISQIDSTILNPGSIDTTVTTSSFYHGINASQITYSISKQLRNHSFTLGQMLQKIEDDSNFMTTGIWNWKPIENLDIGITLSKGQSRYSIDPYVMIINNNPDWLVSLSNVNISFRLLTNWMITGVWSKHRYRQEYADDEGMNIPHYFVDYIGIGLQGRF